MNPARRATAVFHKVFGGQPEGVRAAPGRVNLVGEHTDYQGGFVLPAPLSVQTAVAYRRSGGRQVRAVSANAPGEVCFEPGQTGVKGWGAYLAGVVWALEEAGFEPRGLDLAVASGVPTGSGLSSSAALEVAAARVWRASQGLALDDVAIALLCRRAENEYVGVPSGIMDQFACSVPEEGQAVLLDCRSLEYRLLEIPPGWTFAVVDSGATRSLAASAYAERVAECQRAAAILGLESLRDLEDAHLERLEGDLLHRARHILGENRRVLAAASALQAGDPVAFGRLMSESHASLRDDYLVSSPGLDALVEASAAFEGCFGARLTGAGFGGCTVSLVKSRLLDAFGAHIGARLPKARLVATVHGASAAG